MKSIMIKYLIMSACCVLLWGAACGDTERFEGAAMKVMNAKIAAIDPISGAVGGAVYLDVSNLDSSHKVVFERVAVKLTETQDATPSGVALAEGAKRYSFVVPDVGLGVMEVYVSDGTQKSTPVYFEITAPAGSQNVPPPSDVAEGDEGAGTLGFSGGGEDDKISVDLSMCYCTYNYPDVISNAYLHYVPTELECDKSLGVCADSSYGMLIVSWNVANVKSAYVTVDTNEIQPFIKMKTLKSGKKVPIGYMDFIGDPEKPHIGTKASSMSDMWKSLLDDPIKIFDGLEQKYMTQIEGDMVGRPFNYCRYDVHDNAKNKNDATRCFVNDIASLSDVDESEMNIFLPLLSGEKSKSGTWLFKTLKNYKDDKNYSPFKIYYKEWASGKIKSKEFKVPGVKD